MKKSEIKRKDFKKSLIVSVIINIDFPNSIIDLNSVIKEVKPYLFKEGYNILLKGRIGVGQINFNINKDNNSEIDASTVDSDNYIFKDEKEIYEFNINEQGLLFKAKINKEIIRFDTYAKDIVNVVEIIKKTNQDYLPITKIDLRKLNMDMIQYENDVKDRDYIENHFEEGIFSQLLDCNQKAYKLDGLNNQNKYSNENNEINFNRLLDHGYIIKDNQQKEIRTRFIIDIISSRKSKNRIIDLNYSNLKNELNDILTELNDLCYDFFISSCKLEYLSELCEINNNLKF